MPSIECSKCNGKGLDSSAYCLCRDCGGNGWFRSTKHQENIEDFMDKASQDLPEKPTIPDEKIRELRAKLILEEAIETIEALGFNIYMDGTVDYECGGSIVTFNSVGLKFKQKSEEDINLAEIADGCADLSVVTMGTLSACGIADTPLLDLIDENNLSKFDGKETIREDGKLIKSPNWKAPDIKGLLKKMGYQPEKS